MKASHHRPWPLAAAIAALLAAAGNGVVPAFAGPVLNTGVGPALGPDDKVVLDKDAVKTPARYFVEFNEAPLARYDGSNPKFGAIPRVMRSGDRRKLDAHSAAAQQYVAYLATAQAQHLAGISALLGRTLTPRRSLRHALNAAVVEMTPAEAAAVATADGVRAVRPVGSRVLATDLGPQFIGATSLWSIPSGVSDDIFVSGFDGNTPLASFNPAMGDGIVVGDIDTGYNSLSPSFAAVDDTGYAITNPLGAGNYIGQCNVANISLAGCNNKVIGLYDEINDGTTVPYSVEDTQGHGSHTASTAAGNSRSATINGYTTHVSGVAPHANLVIFYGCAPAPKNCPQDALAGAVDDAIAGGVVDVINFSISGGFDPWTDPDSEAFLSATAAGIFVAAAGGNTSASTPAAIPGTVNHAEPWVTTVAAASHNGGAIAPSLSVTGPGTPPANTQSIGLTENSGDTPLSADIPATTPIKLSPQFDIGDINGTDGCAAYPANAFQNAIALVSRGTCTIVTKVQNAVAAGAVAVVVADNRPEAPIGYTLSPAQPVPSFGITQADGAHLQTFLAANASATATIPNHAVRQSAQPDQLGVFSLLGPGGIDVIKPDVQAPGVSILAAVYNDGSANGPNLVGLMDGTSMATPHTTGAGALLTGVHPDWTPMEIKSALMMTAKEAGLTKPDGVTPSDFFDRGSGRIMVDVASKVGLVMDESATNMQNAAPSQSGAPETLNLASMQSSRCSAATANTCSFTRTFRSTVDHAVTYTASYAGDAALGVAMAPASINLAAGATASVAFNVDATALPADGTFRQGEVVLTPSDAALPKLHLPLAIGVQAPAIAVSPAALSIAIPHGSSTASTTFTVANIGGPTLAVTDTNFVDATPSHVYALLDQMDLSNSGAPSDYFADYAGGQYLSDDFTTVDPSTNLGRIFVPGFMTASVHLATLTGNPVHFRIYRQATSGTARPDGAPEAPATAPNNTPVWQYDATIGQAGLDVSSDNISLDLAAAGAPDTHLAPGTYWLVVYPEVNLSTDGRWVIMLANSGGGTGAEFISPTGGVPDWSSVSTLFGTPLDAMGVRVEQRVACGADWLTTTPSSLSLGGLASAPVTVDIDSSNFDAGVMSEVGYLCVKSSDANQPVTVIRVAAQQN